jgi:hypothetical protein
MDILVSKFAFRWVNLRRYDELEDPGHVCVALVNCACPPHTPVPYINVILTAVEGREEAFEGDTFEGCGSGGAVLVTLVSDPSGLGRSKPLPIDFGHPVRGCTSRIQLTTPQLESA